jgi:hypothetical protein
MAEPASACARHADADAGQLRPARVLNEHNPFKCYPLCGLQLATCLTAAHLDHDASNHSPDNLPPVPDGSLDARCRALSDRSDQTAASAWADCPWRAKPQGQNEGWAPKAALTRKRRAAAQKAATRKQWSDHP